MSRFAMDNVFRLLWFALLCFAIDRVDASDWVNDWPLIPSFSMHAHFARALLDVISGGGLSRRITTKSLAYR
jgi:hypothetical protein